ncbi:hypothetical protein BT63DRAFT_420037 [Microthyrium microscopicum]|uniref:F-box domain-containing protein n=1 Tax=Microthyrium microscopicum TaxID=703497 RepID=A0A6A6UR47_9PEZI|nr:hypothetical protein BT63DRAFT_420037 [Microthyrium microscopicum]
MTTIYSLPLEIIDQILLETVKLNEKNGVAYTFGLSQLPASLDKNIPTNVQKYVRGPTPIYQLKWDAVANLRQVCQYWHEWGLRYAVRDIYVKNWMGSERWLDLTADRARYPLYEMNIRPKGEKVYRNPYLTLQHTREFLEKCDGAAAHVRRIWFNGLYIPETDSEIIATIRSCKNLDIASIPWSILRHSSPQDLAALLTKDGEYPLRALELQAITLSEQQRDLFAKAPLQNPLISPLVNFSQLRKLKLFGNTNIFPINDRDLFAIAKTATNLDEFHMTCISTITMDGVMAIVRASQKTLRVLEHSPRSDDGFMHPHPGYLSNGDHICELLTSCPKLEDVSISIPNMCADLFSNKDVRWKDDCQVRARGICGEENLNSNSAQKKLAMLLEQARNLISARGSGTMPTYLTLELFFAEMIFDPHLHAVHGSFEDATIEGVWPSETTSSSKGPYGSTGLFGKEEEEEFQQISERDFFAGLGQNFIRL